METAKYILENESGQRFDLTAPASIFMVNVEGLGAVGENKFAPLGDGFFFLTDEERSQEAITGELIYQAGAYANYQSLVNWLMKAKTLFFVYGPLDAEYRRVVKLRYINKAKRDGAGWMRSDISFDPVTPWYQESNADLSITVRTGNIKAYKTNGTYVYTDLIYGGEAASDMSAIIYPTGHEPAALLLRYYGAVVNPTLRLVGASTGEVYGICDIDATLISTDTLEFCSQRENSYVRKIAADGTITNLLNDVNLAFDPYFRAPVSEPAVISIESSAPITGSAELTIYSYFRSV